LVKKEFTSFDVAAVVRELKASVVGSRVNNVYQLDGKTLLLKLHKPDEPALRLVLEAGRRLHLTSYLLEKPLAPPAFCMAVRKYLRNGWLMSVEQYEFERVVVFGFKTKVGLVRLVLEVFGDGNIILVGEDGRILQALRYKRMRDRNVVRGEVFLFAPSGGKNPLNVGKEEFRSGLAGFGGVEVVRGLARFLGVGGVYAEEVLLRAGVDKNKHCDALGGEEVDAVFDCLQALLVQVKSGGLEPCVVLDESDGLVDVVPFRLRRYDGAGFKLQRHEVFSDALDEFYVRVTAVEKALAGVEVDQLKREAERLGRVIADQEKVVAEAEARADEDRRIGDVIYAYSGDLQTLLDRFSAEKQSGKEWSAIVKGILADKKAGLKPGVLFESFDARNLVVNVCVDGLGFGLGLRRSLFESAAGFYERGKRSRQRLEGAKSALEDSRRKLADVEGRMREAERLEHVKPVEAVVELEKRRVRRREWFEKFRWFVSSDGFLVVGGKDATSNEVLIKKHTDKDDIVFHADIIGAPFVVVKTEGKKPSEQCLKEAAEFAATYSRGWREGFGSVDVYWVKPEQLSKGGPSGESVGHGAFVVRGERNWMRGTPLKLAIGIRTEEDDTVRVIGGPISAIKSKTDVYVVVVPGDISGKELFKLVLRGLTGKGPRELHQSVKLSTEDVREFIPYGKGRILEDKVQSA
jgi:predicted ribosome quality control (RQC) complex YloA/Tae2 family protein